MTELLTATDLEQWSERNDSREHLPTLVRRLILAVAAPETLRMPADEAVGPGSWARAATPRTRRSATTGSGSTGQPGTSAQASSSCS